MSEMHLSSQHTRMIVWLVWNSRLEMFSSRIFRTLPLVFLLPERLLESEGNLFPCATCVLVLGTVWNPLCHGDALGSVSDFLRCVFLRSGSSCRSVLGVLKFSLRNTLLQISCPLFPLLFVVGN